MANKVYIDVIVDDKGTTQRVAVSAKKLGIALNEAGVGAVAADRAMKGAAGISSNTTKNFAKMSQGITGGLVPAYAALAANVFALTAAFNYLKSAGALQQLMQGQVAYSSATGKGMISLTKSLQTATGAQLSYQEAAQAGAIGVAAGLSTSQITALGKAARDVSAVLGRDLTDSFNRLVRGITKAEPELLDELGIILRLDIATKNYTTALNIQGRQLTINEKSQAVYLETIRQVNEKYGELIEGIEPNAWQMLAVSLSKVNDTFKLFLNDYLAPLAVWFTEHKVAFGLVFLPLIKSITSAMIPGLNNMAKGLETVSIRLKAVKLEAQAAQAALAGMSTAQASSIIVGTLGTGSKVGGAAEAGTLTSRQVSNTLSQIKKIKAGSKAPILNPALLALNKKQLQDLEIALLRMATTLYTTPSAARAAEASLMTLTTTATTAGAAVGFLGRAAGFLSAALSALNWVFLILSVGTLVYSLIKARDTAKELTGEEAKLKIATDTLLSSTKASKEEFQKFNDTQEKLLSKSGNIVNFFDALANRILAAGSALEALSGKTIQASLVEDLKTYSQNIKDAIPAAASLTSGGDMIAYSKLLPIIESGEYQKQFFDTITEDSPASLQALKNISEEYSNIEELLKKLPPEIGKGSKAVQYYMSVAKELQGITVGQVVNSDNFVEVFNKIILKLQEAEKGVQELAATTQGYIRDSNQFLQTEQEVTQQVFAPVTDLEAKYASIQSFLIEYGKIQEKISMDSTNYSTEWIKNEKEKAARATHLASVLEILISAERRRNLGIAESQALAAKAILGKTPGQTELINQRASLEQSKYELQYAQKLLQVKQDEVDILAAMNLQINEKQLQELDLAKATVMAEEAKVAQLERQLDVHMQIFDAANKSLESGLQTNIAALIKGEEKSLKDAMLNIAKGMLTSVADVMAKNITNMIMGTSPLQVAMKQGQIIASSFLAAGKEVASNISNAILGKPITATTSTTAIDSGISIASSFNTRVGGILGFLKSFTPFATGGVVTSPTLGLVGEGRYNEAVVPLPNGKAIPVQMNGAGNQNNVTVNVAIDNQGNASSNSMQDSQQAGNLGQVIARAVQQELQNQKRSGGILNPYGVA